MTDDDVDININKKANYSDDDINIKRRPMDQVIMI